MKVFDISFWQPDNAIQWISGLGAEGVILRLGLTFQGRPELDEKFDRFFYEAKAAHLPIGIYYYSKMQTYEMARMEAQFINDKVYEYWHGYDEPSLGTWLDMEDTTTKFNGIHEMTMYCRDTLLNWGFKIVGVYASYSYFHDYLDILDLGVRQVPVWNAEYDYYNALRQEHPELNHYGWQFTESYNGNVLDGNEWYVKPAE